MTATKKLTADEIKQRAALIDEYAERVDQVLHAAIAMQTPNRLLSSDEGDPYGEEELETMVQRSVQAVRNVMYCWL